MRPYGEGLYIGPPVVTAVQLQGNGLFLGPVAQPWLSKDFIQEFNTIEPMSNFQIIDKCKELKMKNFKGEMRDELKNKKASCDKCIVLNIDHNSNEGTHWTCLYIKMELVFILIHTELNLHWKY